MKLYTRVRGTEQQEATRESTPLNWTRTTYSLPSPEMQGRSDFKEYGTRVPVPYLLTTPLSPFVPITESPSVSPYDRAGSI